MHKIAVLIPCYNEELTIGKVIDDVKKSIPEAEIMVFNNNSSDQTPKIAVQHGATVIEVKMQGKGAVVREMFKAVSADIGVMVDGDDTYEIGDVKKLIDAVKEGADMAVGDRLSTSYLDENKRPFHGFGNTVVKHLVNFCFRGQYKDVMTGYRAFSSRFMHGIQLRANDFTIETEMSIMALRQSYKVVNVPVGYRDRPAGSFSKLNTFKDGLKVLLLIARQALCHEPFTFFAPLNLAVFLAALGFLIAYFGFYSTSAAVLGWLLALTSVFLVLMLAQSVIKLFSRSRKDPAKKADDPHEKTD